MKLDVILTPAYAREGDLEGCLCAVVDVLRATSTITVALVNGAAAVYPCLSAAEARRRVEKLSRSSYLLGGEEMGLRIPGFDLGNSPVEYAAPGAVKGRSVFFYTSNGTPAIRRAYTESGSSIYIASLLNMSAVAAALARDASRCPRGGRRCPARASSSAGTAAFSATRLR